MQINRAFSLLELLVAMSVLSVLMVLLLSLVDGTTRLWRQNENRVDSYREARAALNIIAMDMESLYASPDTKFFQINPQISLSPAIDKNLGDSLFFITALPLDAQESGSKSDLCTVGYYMGWGRTAPNEKYETPNLYRYFISSNPTFTRIKNSEPLFTADGPNSVELVARNITSFKIEPKTADGTAFAQNSSTPLPAYLDITLVAVNKETANRLQDSKSAWTDADSPALRAETRTFTTRVFLDGANRANALAATP